ncbi:hypothetical protein B0E52_13785 [Rhodanobacter sp. C06]|uniref:hypothetical protein n=1 Tax=Rhodanobacter sp. C06 TaxID=1945854 RepID=UPI000985CC6B|nr:hypothetical protein [Rhodanobacter sp. C06]OOG38745.1 hypothetical protein B0E52_13785 [Rhodanobacter sp. C06]
MEATTLIALPIVLALEPQAGAAPRASLGRDEADELAALVATDLQALLPQVAQARLVLAGALFDPVELLRPGFPVWATLEELGRRVPRAGVAQVVAFGSHEGHMPALPLEPSPQFADGPMRLLPLSLLAPETLAEELAEQVEVQLVGRGEAGARTADWLIRTLGVQLEHARYLSRNDLMALTCVQYEHVNLAPLWSLLEAALLTPNRAEEVLSARGLALRYEGGRVLAQSPAAWLAAQAGDPAQCAHDFAGIVFELRQYAALLDAHALPLRLQSAPEGDGDSGWLLETVAAADPVCDAPRLYAHEAPGLGVVAVTAAQHGAGGRPHVLAHGYPLQPRALGPLLAALAERHGCAAELQAPGRIVLDAQGRLAAPAMPLH